MLRVICAWCPSTTPVLDFRDDGRREITESHGVCAEHRRELIEEATGYPACARCFRPITAGCRLDLIDRPFHADCLHREHEEADAREWAARRDEDKRPARRRRW